MDDITWWEFAVGATGSRLPPFSEPHHDISDLHLVQSYFLRFRPTSLHKCIQKPPSVSRPQRRRRGPM